MKDILLVGLSVVLFGTPVTFIQYVPFTFAFSPSKDRHLTQRVCFPIFSSRMVGYSVALAGLVVFKTKPEIVDGYLYKLRTMIGR